MFDIGWSELAVIALVAIVVIGPKDLPAAMRTAAQWIRKIRSLASEFQSGLNEIVREAELDELRRDIDRATSVDIKNQISNTIDPGGSVAQALDVSQDLRNLDRPAETVGAEAGGAAASADPAASIPASYGSAAEERTEAAVETTDRPDADDRTAKS
jgi:sec-independent protein translocase protein TatB